MINISKQKAQERYSSLPENLKDALFSNFNTDLVWHIGENNSLSNDKIKILATIVGDVIMGFLSVDDFESELKTSINNLNPENTSLISGEIKQKIFSPIAEELKTNYAPPTREEFISHPADHPFPEPLPHEGVFSPLKYEELRVKNNLPTPRVTEPESKAPQTEPAPKEILSEEVKNDSAKPFMLHEESGLSRQTGDRIFSGIPKLDLKTTNYGGDEQPSQRQPVSARLEIGPVVNLNKSDEVVRLVHYTNFITKPNLPPIQAPKTFNLPERRIGNPSQTPSPTSPIPQYLPQNPKIERVPTKPLVRGGNIAPIPIRPAFAPRIEGNTIFLNS
jgi:hypothetical protein